jgi:hypothetical protein
MALEISRYCIPWTPLVRPLAESRVALVTTAGVHHRDDPPFVTDGDLSFRAISSATRAIELRVADTHYDHACVDRDLNAVFPIDRLRELANQDHLIAAPAERHFATGFTAELRRFRDETVPQVVAEVARLRPQAVVFTGG